MPTIIFEIVAQGLKLGVMLLGNHLLAKWLGALQYHLEAIKDPELKRLTNDEYQRLNVQFKDTLKKDQPLP